MLLKNQFGIHSLVNNSQGEVRFIIREQGLHENSTELSTSEIMSIHSLTGRLIKRLPSIVKIRTLIVSRML